MKNMDKGKSKLRSSSSSRAPKLERKIVEKNRRNRMKILYSNLLSLLPDHGSKQTMSLPDQIGEVVGYVERLKMNLEKMKEMKGSLMPTKSSNSSIITSSVQTVTEFPRPLVEVLDMGPNMDVILISGLEKSSKFYSIVQLLQEDGTEIVNGNFSMHGNSSIQILHNKVGNSTATMSRRVKDLICGSTSSSTHEVESNLNLWDFEIQSNNWELGILGMMIDSFHEGVDDINVNDFKI